MGMYSRWIDEETSTMDEIARLKIAIKEAEEEIQRFNNNIVALSMQAAMMSTEIAVYSSMIEEGKPE